MTWIFNKEKEQVFQEKIQNSLTSNIAYAANCITPLGVVYAGGENELGLSDKVYLLQWDEASNSMRQTKLPDLPVETTNGSLVCIDNTIYFLGGETLTNTTNNLQLQLFYFYLQTLIVKIVANSFMHNTRICWWYT